MGQRSANVTRASWANEDQTETRHLGRRAPMRPCAFLPQFPPSGGFLPHGFHNLLALTFLILGAGLGCFFHAPSLLIKAQCSSAIYSTGERESKGEGEKTFPPLQHVPAFHPKGHLGRGDWFLWVKALSALGQARGAWLSLCLSDWQLWL